MKLGRPQLLKLPQIQVHNADLLAHVFSANDSDVGEYWDIFSRGAAEQVRSLCLHLSEKGFAEFQGQCDLNNPQSLVSRILAGRRHPKFPKARRDAQIKFLARFAAVGQYVSARTWKRSASRRDDDFLSSPEPKIQPEIGWTKETD